MFSIAFVDGNKMAKMQTQTPRSSGTTRGIFFLVPRRLLWGALWGAAVGWMLAFVACEPTGALRLPNGSSALCANDTDCPKDTRCAAGLCLVSNTQGSETTDASEGLNEPSQEADIASENTMDETTELPVESELPEHPVEPVLEGGNEVFPDADPDVLPEGTAPERVLSCKPDEVCGDGLDNNCNGQIDEGCEPCTTKKPCSPAAACQSNGSCKAASCQNDGDCPSDTICRDDLCVACDEQDPAMLCPTGRLCVAGRCMVCAKDADCLNGDICRQGVCSAPQCKQSTDCVNGLLCINGRCDFCTEDKDCGPDKNCVNKVCQKAECAETKDCLSGLLCVGGRCTGCTADVQCNGVKCDTQASRCQVQIASFQNGSITGNRWQDGGYAISCQEYFNGKPGYIESKTDGVYWIKPAASATPFAVYCLMTEKGGGWTLILKADGSRKTFVYDAALWTNAAVHNAPDLQMDLNEAKLASFSTVPFQSVLLAFSEIKAGAPRLYLSVNKSASSFQSLMQQGRSIGFDPPLPTVLGWRLLLPNGVLQGECHREAFNAHGDKNILNDYPGIKVRFGILGSPDRGCSNFGFGPQSFIGIGANDTLGVNGFVGSDRIEAFKDNARKRMGYLFVR